MSDQIALRSFLLLFFNFFFLKIKIEMLLVFELLRTQENKAFSPSEKYDGLCSRVCKLLCRKGPFCQGFKVPTTCEGNPPEAPEGLV